MTSQGEHSILISPVGELDTELIEAVAGKIKQVFGFSTETRPILQDLSFALDDNRHQYHSTAILDRLAANIPPHAVRVLAIAQVDLFIPILTHVYGEAQLGGAACIVSTFRLNEGLSGLNITPKYIDRIVKETIHELGHTFNLRHCPEHTCIMHYCRNEEDVDRKSDQLCRYCIIMLADEIKRLKLSWGFQLVKTGALDQANKVNALFDSLDPFMPSRTDAAWSKEMRSVVAEFRKGAKDYEDKEIENIVDEAVDALRKAG